MHGMVLTALHIIAIATGLAWLALQFTTRRPIDDARWYWLRWSAMAAFLAAWGIVALRSGRGVPFRVPSMTLLLTSVGIACLQWFHVWFVAWPLVHTGGARPRAEAALAVNRATSVPLVFFFWAASWATELGGDGRYVPTPYWLATAAVYGGLALATLAAPRLVSMLLGPWPSALLAGAGLLLTLRWM